MSSSTSLPPPPPRRPRLLAPNRKLRHLRGLSLRNLCFAPPPARILRSLDDADLPGPQHHKKQQLAALQESSSDVTAGASLASSRSSENLARLQPSRQLSGGGGGQRLGAPPMPRRMSLSNAHASPISRQKKLEDLADEAVGDVFFSLHDPASPEEPIYISETGERSAVCLIEPNFDFRFFDLSTQHTNISRSCKLLVRIWTRRPKHTTWSFLLEELIDLRRLHFISTTLNREYRPNALIFHLEDGVYSLDFPDRISEPRQHPPPATTSSYNALMKLANLEGSLRDAEETQRAVARQMNELLATDDGLANGAADAAEEGVVLANKYLATQRRLNRQSERRRDELRASLRARREAITEGRALQRRRAEDMAASHTRLLAAQRLLEDTEQQIRGQRRRICTELAAVFPITPVPHAPPLSFQICGLPLPNSVYDAAVARSVGEEALSAALGLVALLARHLQFYLAHPLPYEVAPLVGSRAYIRDDISHLAETSGNTGKTGTASAAAAAAARREFPLFLPRGGSTTGQWRFEYAWFLLNKDIEALCASQALRVVDIRHTLPNLKYLLYVGSAGRDEMPERKKGGVRGLWAGRLTGRVPSSPLLLLRDDASSNGNSRPASADSAAHAQRGDALRSAALADQVQPQQKLQPAATGWGGVSGTGGANPADFALPFRSPETKFTLRTKGLRENVAN
ncbi:UV radiation resistance protein, putative [Cordyceps militaris CM01]|uniref:UV radiation resistance protein, putative n=1 Tax=Cordyceps militaris (strain CM01) TaxID=983644 RepID=G3JQZ0_CORMM|nr:UV radiation resistance protein, putative [Cordyceps militaris CM01]EGX89434.1 UV radiation resistance protein, putative [Cordyceps militaris CM01]